MSSQCLTLGSSFLYKFTKSASFYNAKPILTKSNALLAIKFPGSQCLGTGMTASLTIVIPLRVSGIYALRYCE
ncbi:hypothetical protein [Wolbachia endosymbiont (group A) of Anomoia purmunda]|uniref:hypothetical protein n=1 Tax=Wolbachia endosymbiont (group A) of Anomoia purmunda TaxID=2953978 RepID=UPI0022301B06|nr:hypothetical protein [Wolbachia endosymbiont (group A) of Anomoia purmunda]